MKPGFEPGITRSLTIIVTPDMCPAFDGVVVHRVYSTWSVAHHFELAARKVLVDFLEAHEEGIGSHVSVDHLAPCPVGGEGRVEARLVEVNRAHHVRVVCECRAFLEPARAANPSRLDGSRDQREGEAPAEPNEPRTSVRATLRERAANFSSRGPSDSEKGPKLLATGKQVQVVMNKEQLQRYLERS